MSDLLSAASLLLTIVTVLYGLWYPGIAEELETEVPEFKAQCIKPYKRVCETFKTRALPLTCATSLISIVFAYDALLITHNTLNSFMHIGIGSTLKNYCAVSTAFVLVVILSLLLTLHLIMETRKLYLLKRKLRRGINRAD